MLFERRKGRSTVQLAGTQLFTSNGDPWMRISRGRAHGLPLASSSIWFLRYEHKGDIQTIDTIVHGREQVWLTGDYVAKVSRSIRNGFILPPIT